MPQSRLSDRRILVLGFVVFCLIVTAQAWARNQAQPRPEAVLVEDQPPDPRIHLEATMRDDVIVGSVTAFRKDGRPRTDAGGNILLLNAGGERVGQVPLDLTGPGQFRFVVSTHRLEAGGHLEVYLPGGGQVSEERLLYRVGLGGEGASWVLSAAKGLKPMSVGATEGPDAFGYTWDDTAVFNWVDASGGPSISLRDDYWVGPFDIGFDFKFYGRTYGEFYVDSNGYIGFDGEQTASYPGNGSLKDASRPNSIIAPFWYDLDPSRGGTVRYRTLGSAPNRRLVVSWRDVPLSDSVSDLQSFQVILHEDSNDITFQYPDTREGMLGDGSSATIGIENEDGTIALAYPLLIPINVSHAIHFDYGQQPYNTFVTPKRLGGIVAAGEEASFPLKIKNLGYNSDSFSVERLEFEGSDWAINFYEADGTTPLADNETGPIEPGDEREIVIKVDVPEDAEVGESVRAEVRADSENFTPTPEPPEPTPETPTPTPTDTPTLTPTPDAVRVLLDLTHGGEMAPADTGDFGQADLLTALEAEGYEVDVYDTAEAKTSMEYVDAFVDDSGHSQTFEVPPDIGCLVLNVEHASSSQVSFRAASPSGVVYQSTDESLHIHEPETGTWDVTVYGPADGASVRLDVASGPDALNPTLLSAYDILITNPGTTGWLAYASQFSPEEEAAIEDFVEEGNGLLWLRDFSTTGLLKPIIHITSRKPAELSVVLEMNEAPTLIRPEAETRVTDDGASEVRWGGLQVAPDRPAELWYEAMDLEGWNEISVSYVDGVPQLENTGSESVQNLHLIGRNAAGYYHGFVASLAPQERVSARLRGMGRSSLESFLRERVVKEGISAGLSADEAEGFFERWQWVRLWMQTLEEQRAPSGLLLYQLHEDRMDEAVSMTIDAGGESVETSRVIWMDVRDVPFVDDVVVSETADVPDPEPVPAVDSVVSVHEYGVIDTAYRLAEDKEVMRQSSAVIPQSMGDGSAFGISFYDEEVTDGANYHLYNENPIISDFTDIPAFASVFQGVSSFVLSTASPVVGYEDPASSIAWGSESCSSPRFDFGAPPPVMAGSQVGEGRVVGVGDSHFTANYYLGLSEYENRELILNILDWLAGQVGGVTTFRGTVTGWMHADALECPFPWWEVEVEEVLSGASVSGEVWVPTLRASDCECDAEIDPYIGVGDLVAVRGVYDGAIMVEVCGSDAYYVRAVPTTSGGRSTYSLTTSRSFGAGTAGRGLQAYEVSASSRGGDGLRVTEGPGGRSAEAARVEAPLQGGSGHDDTSVGVVVGTTFAQVYTDNESGDGTEDPENYFDPIQEGKQTPRRITTDEDESSYAAVATMPDGNAVNVWNTSYYNGTTWVEEINYAILDPSGSFVLPVTRLTDNSSADEATYDFGASADVAPNGNVAIGWSQQQDTDGDLAFNRSNARYVVVSSRGGVLRPPTFLTNNTGDYPRDYPPAVAALTSGRFLLAWEHAASPSGPVDIYYAVLNNDGSIARPKARLTDGTGFDVTPRVAPMPDGRAAIVWTTYDELGYREIAYATVDGSGSVTSGPIQITDNGSSGFESRRADVVALSDGRLAVAWTRETYGDQQIQYTIISGSEPPTPVTETPTATPETPTATPETPTATPTETPTPTPSLTPTTPPPRWVTIASQDFEGAFPGDWNVYEKYGSQHGNYEWGKRHCRRYAGGYSGWPVGGGVDGSALGCGDNYPNLAWSWLIYGPFSLTDATAAELRFKMWLNTEAGYDLLLWCGSTDGNSFECDYGTGSTSGQWVDVVADLSSLEGVNYLGQPNVWVALIFYSDTYVNEPEGAYVDNILLRKFASPGHVQIESGSSLEGLTPLEVPEQIRLRDGANDAIHGAGRDRPQPGSVGSPGHANWVIRTVPNDLSRANLYVSLTTDEDDNLIMTWLDNLGKQYVFYALAGRNGNIRTPATILQRTRHSSIWSSKNGQGNDVLIPGVIPQKPVTVYLPAVLKNYRSGPPVPPVVNGGFESGEHGWTFGKDTSNSIRPAPRPDVVGSRAHSGSWAAVLGDENAPCDVEIGVDGYRLRSWISQDVRVPDSGTARLSFHYRMLTYDKWSADEFDRLEIYLDGTLIGNLGNTASNYGCGNPINDLGWRQFTYDLGPYRGRTVRLKLVNVTDPDRTYSTWTYVDDVEVRP